MSSDLSSFARTIFTSSYGFTKQESWHGASNRVVEFLGLPEPYRSRAVQALTNREVMPGGRYWYAAGRKKPQINNCFLLRAGDSAEEWFDTQRDAGMATSKGGGVGVNYTEIRPRGSKINGYGGVASGPVSLMQMINENTRQLQDGAGRRGALWAGLHWDHPDVEEMVTIKDWDEDTRQRKAANYLSPAPLDMTNISIELDDEFFRRINAGDVSLRFKFMKWVDSALRTGEPGFSINLGDKWQENLRNPCCEVTSEDNADVCNLGSVNLSRITSLDHLEESVRLLTRMLLRGSERGWLPQLTGDAHGVRAKNRRIGVGLMGLHDWCVQRDIPYGPSAELGQWLRLWEEVSDDEARTISREMNMAPPKGIRAIAPTGTIGILAETSTGIEPMFAAAYRRSYIRDDKRQYQYVIDPIARTALEHGVDPTHIEDAYTLAHDVERRLEMQAFVQEHVDMAISSTINLPAYGTPGNDDTGKMCELLLRYLPRLRGLTLYPDGARAGQPLERVDVEEAVAYGDTVFETVESACSNGVCGI